MSARFSRPEYFNHQKTDGQNVRFNNFMLNKSTKDKEEQDQKYHFV